jgi:hypothetical protein
LISASIQAYSATIFQNLKFSFSIKFTDTFTDSFWEGVDVHTPENRITKRCCAAIITCDIGKQSLRKLIPKVKTFGAGLSWRKAQNCFHHRHRITLVHQTAL